MEKEKVDKLKSMVIEVNKHISSMENLQMQIYNELLEYAKQQYIGKIISHDERGNSLYINDIKLENDCRLSMFFRNTERYFFVPTGIKIKQSSKALINNYIFDGANEEGTLILNIDGSINNGTYAKWKINEDLLTIYTELNEYKQYIRDCFKYQLLKGDTVIFSDEDVPYIGKVSGFDKNTKLLSVVSDGSIFYKKGSELKLITENDIKNRNY